jgi:GT2 family glycosyltransferase
MKKLIKIDVSVIIPTFRDWDRLQLCLNALVKQTYPTEYYQIIIVNNDPEDRAPSSLCIPSNCIILEEEKPGSYAARNAALKVAKGEIFAFTDSDCIPQKDWMEVAVKYFENNEACDRIGGKIRLFSKNDKFNWVELYEVLCAFPQQSFVESQGMAATGNMFTKKYVIENVGMFDERLMSGGDSEWGRRANSKGFTIHYVDDCVIDHPTRPNFKDIKNKTKRLAGGHINVASIKGKAGRFKILIKSVAPPFWAIKLAIDNKELSWQEKVKALFVAYYLKFLVLPEKAAIILFRKKAERV